MRSAANKHPFLRSVLVVDDDPRVVKSLVDSLSARGYAVDTATTAAEAVVAAERSHPSVVFLDLMLPDESGLEVFERLRRVNPEGQIVVITGKESLEYVITAKAAGAFDFIMKSNNDLIDRVLSAAKNACDALDKAEEGGSAGVSRGGVSGVELVSRSKEMRPVLDGIEKLASSRVSVLIQGSSGTGKEVVARAIHSRGSRASGRFVAVNCAGIPDPLLESELFGYERGAFTGAIARKIGKFELADGGTIFLDEIGEMSLSLQAKILRVVQDKCFERLGGNDLLSVDVRVLSATNRDLAVEVAEGRFREDLFYRLAVFTLTVPDLNRRREDIEYLSQQFLMEACREEGREPMKVSHEVKRIFAEHDWPGNVRQLQNVIKHMVVVCEGDLATIHHLPDAFTVGMSVASVSPEPALVVSDESETVPVGSDSEVSIEIVEDSSIFSETALNEMSVAERLDRSLDLFFPDEHVLPSMGELETAAIRFAMKRLSNNRTRVAKRLHISRATLYRRLDPGEDGS